MSLWGVEPLWQLQCRSAWILQVLSGGINRILARNILSCRHLKSGEQRLTRSTSLLYVFNQVRNWKIIHISFILLKPFGDPSRPAWKHIHSLCFSTHIFSFYTQFSLFVKNDFYSKCMPDEIKRQTWACAAPGHSYQWTCFCCQRFTVVKVII